MEIVKFNKANCDVKYLDKVCENLLNSKKKLIDMSPEELDICYNYLIQGNDSPLTHCKKYTENHLVNLNLSKPATKMRPNDFDICNGRSQVNYMTKLPGTRNQYFQSPPLLELPQNSSLVLPNKEQKVKQVQRKRTDKDLVNLSKFDTKMRRKEFDICNGLTQVNYAKNLPATKNQYSQSPPLLELPQNSSLVIPNKELKIKQGQRKRTDKDLVNLNLSKSDTRMRKQEFDIMSRVNYTKNFPVTSNQYSQSPPLVELPQNSSLVLPNQELKVKQDQRNRTDKDLANLNLSKPDTKMRAKEFDICNGLSQMKLPATKNQYSQSPPLLELPQNSSLVLPNQKLKIKQGQSKRTDKDLINQNLSKFNANMKPREFDIMSQVNYAKNLPVKRNQYSQSPPLLGLPQTNSIVLLNKELKLKLVQRKRVKTHGLSPVVNVDHSNTISNSEVSRKESGQKRKYSSRKAENIN